MSTVLLLVITLAYVSLGLPDTLLGAAWPVMRASLSAPLDGAGVVSMVIAGGTTLSSLLSARLLTRFGTGRVAFCSVLATALALLGFSCSGSLGAALLCALPLGLGAGAVDAGLNNFVALHYPPRVMSFLYCFWGVGALSGPAVLAFWIARQGESGWQAGYRTVALIQLGLVAVLGLALPLWRRLEAPPCPEGPLPCRCLTPRETLALPGVRASLTAFFCDASLEAGAALWTGTFLVEARGVPEDRAAFCASLFYGGMAAGRALSGALSGRVPSPRLIRLGQGLCGVGAGLLLCPLPLGLTMAGLLLLGVGCAPLYPAMLAATPGRFGAAASQSVMGLQLAAATLAAAVTPPLLGLVLQATSPGVFPVYLLGALGAMLVFCERVNRALEPPEK